jgi:hypothetical protein
LRARNLHLRLCSYSYLLSDVKNATEWKYEKQKRAYQNQRVVLSAWSYPSNRDYGAVRSQKMVG